MSLVCCSGGGRGCACVLSLYTSIMYVYCTYIYLLYACVQQQYSKATIFRYAYNIKHKLYTTINTIATIVLPAHTFCYL